MTSWTENRLRSWMISMSFILAIISSSANISSADLVSLNNADFELGSSAPPSVAPGGTSYVGNIPGWNVVNAGGVFEPDFVSEVSYPGSVQATTGNYTAYSNSPTWGLVSQLIGSGITLQANAVYTLSVDVGHRSDELFGGGFGFYRLTNPFPTGFSGSIAIDPGAGNFSRQTHVLYGSNISAGDLGNQFRIGFFASDGLVVDFDNVTLDITTVPEPTVMTLFAPALLFVMSRRKLRPSVPN